MIGKIERLKLRDVWQHEAHDFTTWLEENIDVLNEALDLNLSSVEREQSAGTFSVDLVAEDDSGNLVVIENQLEKSNHDHLGKLITYLTALEAKTAIWIVSEPRPEHVKAITWLNESSGAAFYLAKVEAISIGESPPAPLITLITGPSVAATEAGTAKKELAGRHVERKRFWTDLLDRAKDRTKLHASISPGHYHWVGTSAGLPRGVGLNYTIRKHDGTVELYIDNDRETGAGNKEMFNALFAKKDEIESVFSGDLEWQALEGKRSCRIRKTVPGGGWQDEEAWPQVHDAMIDAMIRLDKALRPPLTKLKVKSASAPTTA